MRENGEKSKRVGGWMRGGKRCREVGGGVECGVERESGVERERGELFLQKTGFQND